MGRPSSFFSMVLSRAEEGGEREVKEKLEEILRWKKNHPCL